jgi:hypothetical protein
MKTLYANIVFIQSADETAEPEKIYREHGAQALLDYLKQWDYGAESETDTDDNEPWGLGDKVYYFNDYIVTVNLGLPYFGLCRKIYREG